MSRMLILPAALCLFIAAGARAGTAVPLVIYGDDDYPPYSYVENGQLKGIYTEIVREAAQSMPQYAVQLRPVPWKRGLLMLQTGEAFALYPPYSWRSERPYVRYSVPLLMEQLVVLCNQDVLARRKLRQWPADYGGLHIGVNAGFLPGDAGLMASLRAEKIVLDPAKGTRTNLLKLMRGRIDCYVSDRLSAQWELQRIRREGPPGTPMQAIEETAQLASQQGHLGFTAQRPAAYPYRDDFIAQFNAAIVRMQNSGAIRRIVDRALQP
ncbi:MULTISPECIES: ABC transporter substrate-binding protein [unclassified Janthinobacterium]|uniref:substrate-binding periplasmic protein n=1 Tax=unclassified Janthinobacterium TaxID=2610881 RepID=UPI002712AFD7|nr:MULTISPECIES: transporter substrate-binding domain-containing protein [unclassified Janthinobacterium]MDO8048745.1 transporter substrate-binding domain-containing protein [Janthinobacterium sp. SUN211]MDO8066118.1 transporter substrate-binding domain-containing protein [Janthinobacterium sp. SUN206]MDO8072343.1 transporter substrate-binding domain-containing protein [Janthinobacterium sp. SUN176]